MLNPDGVVKGNYRFSAAGFDLNRKWKNCKENIQPEIYKIRELIRTLNKEKKVVMYIDIHGHSRKKNVFFYGCCEQDGPINPKPK
jgi:murein tripeptide amidase MpaA